MIPEGEMGKDMYDDEPVDPVDWMIRSWRM